MTKNYDNISKKCGNLVQSDTCGRIHWSIQLNVVLSPVLDNRN